MSVPVLNAPMRRILFPALVLAAALAVHWTAKESSLYVDLELLSVGEIAPDFNLRRLDNRAQSLSTLQGSVVWLIFGRTDEPGTAVQIHEVRELVDAYPDEDIVVMFLAQSQGFDEVSRYVDDNGSAAAVLFDPGEKIAKRYNARHWPTSYIVSRTGRILGANRGVWRASDRTLRRLLDEAIASGKRRPRTTPAPESPPPAPASEATP